MLSVRRALWFAASLCIATSNGVAASDARPRYVGEGNRFMLAIPDGCREFAPAGDVPRYIGCGNAAVRAGFFPGGTTGAALQKAVDAYTGGMHDMRLLGDRMSGTLGGLGPARTITGAGFSGSQAIDVTLISLAKDGGWYVLSMAAPAVEADADRTRYLDPLSASFSFAAQPASGVPPLRVLLRRGSGVALIAHVTDHSAADAFPNVRKALTAYAGAPLRFSEPVTGSEDTALNAGFAGRIGGVPVAGNVGFQRAGNDVMVLIVYDRADRFKQSLPVLIRAVDAEPSSMLR